MLGWLKLPTFDWPTPAWLYRLTQGVHVDLGLVLVPVVIAKLWSVIPRLFDRAAGPLDRPSAGKNFAGDAGRRNHLFEIATGLLFIQYDMIFWFPWHTAHHFGAWVFIAGFLIHVTLKIPKMICRLRSMSMRKVLRANRADTRPEPHARMGGLPTIRGPKTGLYEPPRCAGTGRRQRLRE